MNDTPAKRVAVIAVHGVGSQTPGETSREISGMFGQVRNQAESQFAFDEFSASSLTIPVKARWNVSGNSFTPDVKVSRNAMSALELEPDELNYETTVFHSTASTNSATVKSAQVDVYELYWNDLSHAPTTVGRFLAELYQIFFHLASLGHKAVRFARCWPVAEQSDTLYARKWLSFVNHLHSGMEALLPTTIPVLNLFLLACALPLGVLAIPAHFHALVATLVSSAIAALGVTYFLSHRVQGGAMGAALPLIVAGAVGYGIHICSTDHVTMILMLLALLVGAVLAFLGNQALLSRYPKQWAWGGATAGFAFFAFSLVGGIVSCHPSASYKGVLAVAAWAVYAHFVLLQLAWAVVFVLSILIIVSPWVHPILGGGKADGVYRALQTGRIGVLLSATLFFLTTSILWATVLQFAGQLLSNLSDISIPITYGLLYQHFFQIESLQNLPTLACDLYHLTVGKSANLFLFLLAVSLFIGIIGFTPSALSEGSRPKPATAGQTKAMASWLNGAFKSLIVAELLVIAGWLAFALGYGTNIGDHFGDSKWLQGAGLLLAGAVPSVLAIKGWLPGGFSNFLDIVLDVSNWLKERPLSRSPRGRILVRYLSLLEHLSKKGYDRLVIIAHSQGTVITADCLRMLNQSASLRGDVLGENAQLMPISLVTAGSPLRQLYETRFPHQYGWACPTSKDQGPILAEFGLTNWINVYRSGDYVGRSLWSEPCPSTIKPADTDLMHQTISDHRGDLCLGDGAHLHYFDGSSKVVGIVTTTLIVGTTPVASITN